MGEIVAFRSTRSTPRRPVESTGAGAEILLFTGVRYERWQEPETQHAIGAPKKRLARTRRPRKRA